MVFDSGKARKLEYIPVESPLTWNLTRNPPLKIDVARWGGKIYIALCRQCGERYAEDPAMDARGHPMPDHLFDSEEAKRPVCKDCRMAALGEAFEADLLDMFEEKLGLAEKHRDALKDFIETMFTDPKKIVQVADLDNRVKGLEQQTKTMWAVIGGLIVALLAVVVALVVALVVGA